MKIIVFGPTGGTGRLLAEKAVEVGHTVSVFTRNPAAFAGPTPTNFKILTGSVLDPSAVEAALQGHDAVLSALGGRPWRRSPICAPAVRNITAGMKKHGIRRLVTMSTLGAGDTRQDVGWLARNVIFGAVLRNEVADKEAMEHHLDRLDLDWVVVRVGILGNGSSRGKFRVSDDRSTKGMGKIARADVAEFMLEQLSSDAWLRRKPVIVY